MGRPKKIKTEKVEKVIELPPAVSEWPSLPVEEIDGVTKQEKLSPIAIDFNSETLNNLGRKINEIIAYINEKAL